MPEDHTFDNCRSVDSATTDLLWVGGRPGVDLELRDQFSVLKDGTIVWQSAILWESHCSPFQAQVVWKEAGVILFGAHAEVYALDADKGKVIFHKRLDSYFGYFEFDLSCRVLFVLTGTEVLCFNTAFRELWSTRGLAVDGVVCQELADDFMIVAAEVDPPGGWDRVKIDIATGREISRLPAEPVE